MGRSTFGTASRQAGESLLSPEERFIFPIDAQTIRAVIDIPANALRNPNTDVEAIIEWAPDGTNFQFLCSARLEGRPGNSNRMRPYAEPNRATVRRIVTEKIPVRGRLLWRKAGSGGGWFEVSDVPEVRPAYTPTDDDQGEAPR